MIAALILAVALAAALAWVLYTRRSNGPSPGVEPPPIASIADPPREGPARFEGRVEAVGDPAQAPVSGREAVGWVVEVEVAGSRRPQTKRREDGVPFLVADETGRALVPAGDRTLAISCDHEADPVPMPEAPAWVAEFLRFRGLADEGSMVIVREGVIRPGQRVAVTGIMEGGDPQSRSTGADAVLSGGRAGAMHVAPVDGP